MKTPCARDGRGAHGSARRNATKPGVAAARLADLDSETEASSGERAGFNLRPSEATG